MKTTALQNIEAFPTQPNRDTPICEDRAMEYATSAHFIHAARVLSDEARRRNLVAPSFRSPPHLVLGSRSLRRTSNGQIQVAVVVRGRRWEEVAVDMVAGVLAANTLSSTDTATVACEFLQLIQHDLAEEPQRFVA
jgi:hypothetical protein